MSLGPVVRNVFHSPGAGVADLKDHLKQRLFAEGVARETPDGIMCYADGKLAFVPNYAGENPAPKPRTYKEPAYVPFQGENAYLDPAPMQQGKSPTRQEIYTLQNTQSCGFDVGDIVEKIDGNLFRGKRGRVVGLGAFSGETTLLRVKFDHVQEIQEFYARRFKKIEAAPATAPATRRLTKGDMVCMAPNESEFLRHVGMSETRALQLINDRLVGVIETDDGSDVPYVVRFKFSDGSEKAFWTKEHRVVPAAPAKQDWDPRNSPLQVGDRVLQSSKEHCNTGHYAKVVGVDAQVIRLSWESNPSSDNGIWSQRTHRKCFEIVERPAK